MTDRHTQLLYKYHTLTHDKKMNKTFINTFVHMYIQTFYENIKQEISILGESCCMKIYRML